MYISFLGSDELGHLNDYAGYIKALKTYDDFMDELYTKLESMGEYGKSTTVFLSTDHGRGVGPFFRHHSVMKFTEKKIFLFVKGPHTKKMGRTRKKSHDQTYIRTTVEKIFGLPLTHNQNYLKEVVQE